MRFGRRPSRKLSGGGPAVSQLASGVTVGDLTHPSLDFASTATVAAGQLWSVNLRFFTPGPDTPYWITQLPLCP